MRIIHLCLAALLMTGAVSCQKQASADNKSDNKAETESVEAVKPTPALPSSPKTVKNVKFGISTTGISNHTCRVEPGKPFEIKGWYIADEAVNVTYDLNGKTAPAKIETRGDVKKNYPGYKFAEGWIIKVPPQNLKPENKLNIRIGNTNWPMTITVK